jgi:4-diphosphocytidyl-2-C-methyl-D-erythritol kinase
MRRLGLPGGGVPGRIAGVIRLLAPAKVNLSFEVIGRRDDGFHEVRTVLQAIDLTDEVEIDEAPEISLTVEPAGAVPVRENLVVRAAEALREAVGPSGASGAAITLHKRIPVAAGLGGGSSDAAAALLGLRRLWGVDGDMSLIYGIAASLGSDVPFFLRGGTAIGRGRGDVLDSLPTPVERFAVVVTPHEHADSAKTARMYGLLEPKHYTDGSSTDAVVSRLTKRFPIGTAMRNTFMAVAASAYKSYEVALSTLATTEADTALLAGAGPSLFTLVDDAAKGERIMTSMATGDYEAHVARLLGPWSSDGLAAT